MGRPFSLHEPPQRCHACAEFPLYMLNRSSIDQGYLNLATDFTLLCAACYDLARAAALLPFLRPPEHTAQARWIECERERLENRRRANRLEAAR